MLKFTKDQAQPISLTDAAGQHWSDNGDGTITLMNDPDGERDFTYNSTWAHLPNSAHTYDCRVNYGEASMCPGGEDCVDMERSVYARQHGLSAFAERNWGVEL